MDIFQTVDQARSAARKLQRDGRQVGLIPTMGALHRGHESLIQQSTIANDDTFVSIFINPTQFGDAADLDRYPRPLEDDLRRCRDLGVRGVFTPTKQIMYPDGMTTTIVPPDVSKPLEGLHRPGHFAGVCTIVLKLFGVLPADNAWFGKKDYQQLAVIRSMVADLNVPIEVRSGETVRDTDSLALSSRNEFLDAEQRRRALAIPIALNTVVTRWRNGQRDVGDLEQSMAQALRETSLEYATIRNARTFREPTAGELNVALIATRVGETRLIDNVELFP